MSKKKGDLTQNVQQAVVFLAIAQELHQKYNHNSLIQELLSIFRKVYIDAVGQEQAMLKQRAKMHWLKEGDQCSRIFFKRIRQKGIIQRLFQITSLPGKLISDYNGVQEEFVRHRLSTDEADALVLPVQRREVYEALINISDDKAPGSDGYSACFFKSAWAIIGNDIPNVVLDFFHTGRLLKQIIATVLALIPKVHSPSTMADFIPIACCNVLYKIISKILVKCMQGVMAPLVDCSQNAFVSGRKIADNILLAQELLAAYNQKNLPPRCAVKVDLRKAYDTECVTTTAFSINLNGSLQGFFKGARGLRRGTPYPPTCLSSSWKCFIRYGFRYHWKCARIELLMLYFADDLLLFCEVEAHSVTIIHQALEQFASLSGL
ncbi:UNVERIFIED_CONTAM: hypothetical protein Slati_2973600 [Sesamum latifolium]|uniref:Reverse transcriptase domain-containing protein n=1 Tax=Sesamum latifolium TaxID=2727402 RepID=A0AAW2VFG4_9LAMI